MSMENMRIMNHEAQRRNKEIEKLKTRIAELEAKTEWRDMSTAPKDGAKFIIAADDFVHPVVAHYSEKLCAFTSNYHDQIEWPKYWMQLPEAPHD